MSTRAAIRIKDDQEELWFYCHGDGYPVSAGLSEPINGVLPDLIQMRQWLQTGAIRDNLKQASGWLVIIGRQTLTLTQARINPDQPTLPPFYPDQRSKSLAWKASQYEPCSRTQALEDYRFLYTLHLKPPSITIDHPRPKPAPTEPKQIPLV